MSDRYTLDEVARTLADDDLRAKAVAFDAFRNAHHIPFADEEHQGGNCADMLLGYVTRVYRLESAVDATLSLLALARASVAGVALDTDEDRALQDRVVATLTKGMGRLESVRAESIVTNPLNHDAA